MFIYKMNPYNYQNERQQTCVQKGATMTWHRAVTWTGAQQTTIQGSKQMTPGFTCKSRAVWSGQRGTAKWYGHTYNKCADFSKLGTIQKKGESAQKERTHHSTQNGGASKQDGATSVQHYELRSQPILATSHAMSPTLYGFVNSYFHIKWEWNKMQALSVCVDTCTGILLIRPGLSSL